MLWQRLLTAMVLVPLVVAGILLLDTRSLAIAVGAMILVGAWELARLVDLPAGPARPVFVGGIAAVMVLAWQLRQPSLIEPLQWLMTAWWIGTTLLLLSRRSELARVEGPRIAVLMLGSVVLLSAWMSIVVLHGTGSHGPRLVLFLFVLVWVADSGAYFAGRAFGRRKLSPFVSPGKTWAGAVGAAVGVALSAAALAFSGWVGSPPMLPLVLLCVLVTAVSIGGDLWESRLKREAGVKDSGNLLPGHGGMLDRIDSLLAAAPVFGLGVGLIGFGA
ncbi:MAG: phosphatidate cytidylyltransferase [Gammaproteobacteria bacterium]|nr:phosphatidate cytidylyltransferase [Gammaproteobacteria bacterium]